MNKTTDPYVRGTPDATNLPDIMLLSAPVNIKLRKYRKG